MSEQALIFEQPLNEAIRICLRLEKLDARFQYEANQQSGESSEHAMMTLLDTLKFANRPDLKSKLTQALAQFNLSLSQLEQAEAVDQTQLSEIKSKVLDFSQRLHLSHGRIGDNLRDYDFLNSVLLQISAPGGICEYASPIYTQWLNQPLAQRMQQLKAWYQSFDLLIETSELILHLVRHANVFQPKTAEEGFYQQTIPSTPLCQMIRIKIAAELDLFPEISVGKYRLSVHFLKPSYSAGKRANRFGQDVAFQLMMCQI